MKKEIKYFSLSKILINFLGSSNELKEKIMYTFFEYNYINHISTIGIQYEKKSIGIDYNKYRIEFWDTAGQERMRAITKSFIRNANGIIFVYDASYRSSFELIKTWYSQIDSKIKIKVLVIGMCEDGGKRVVKKKEGEELASQYGGIFIDVGINDKNDIITGIKELIKMIIKEHGMKNITQLDHSIVLRKKKKVNVNNNCVEG